MRLDSTPKLPPRANTALDELYGLGFANYETEDAKIEAVTLADVQSAARKHLATEAAVTSVIQGTATS